MHQLLLLVCIGIGSNTFFLISGLSFKSKYDFITTSDFSLVCTMQGPLTTSIIIQDPSGTTAGSCLPSPIGCASGPRNTIVTNTVGGTTTVTIDILESNINIPTSEGSWSCSNGTDVAYAQVKIFSCTKPVIQTEVTVPITGTIITVLIGCIYPYPDEVKISYVKKSAQSIILKSRNDVKFDNGTSTNCPVPDTRAISINGTFLVSTDNLNGEEALIAVTVLLNSIQLGMTGYSNFSILSEKGCNYSDTELFLGGFSCFLIGLITFIIMLIILHCKVLPKIFGDLSTKKKIKIILIIVFIVVALIIGLTLGLITMNDCDQRDLGLGLGLGLGFSLAIALAVTLCIFHKKCDSKKGNEDENRESPTKINSKKPEDNPERVRSTASASHVKMESKVHSEN